MSLSKARKIAIIRGAVEKIVRLLSGKNIPVYQIGSKAYVKWNERTMEAESVHLPVIPDDASDTLLLAVQGFLDHEVAHILYTDFLVVVEAVSRRVDTLHNMVEDCFIEQKMAKEFAGSDTNLEYMRGVFLDKYTQPALNKLPSDAPESKWWAILGIVAMRAWSGQLIFRQFMDENNYWDKIQGVTDKLSDLIPLFASLDNSQQALSLALKIKKKLYGDKNDSNQQENTEKEKGDKSSSGKKQSQKKSDPQDQESDQEESGDSDNDSGDSDSGDSDSGDSDSGDSDSGDSDDNSGDESDAEGDGDSSESEDESASSDDNDSTSGDSQDGDDAESEDESGDSGQSPQNTKNESQSDNTDTAGQSDTNGLDENESGDEDGDEEDDTPLFDEEEQDELADYDDILERELSEMAQSEISGASYAPITRDWDIIQPVEVPSKLRPKLISEIEDIDQMVADSIAPMQREMERMFRANNRSRFEPGHRSGKVNAASLARMAVGDDRVFRRKEEIKTKEVAVSLVIDCSGSMHGRRIRNAIAAAWALSQVLDRLKISNEVLGFTTLSEETFEGNYYKNALENVGITLTPKLKAVFEAENKMSSHERNGYSRLCPIYMPIFKDWHESFSNKVKERMAVYAAGDALMWTNADGESIMYAAQRLMQQRQPGKTMIVLSDGEPNYDGGHRGAKPSTHLQHTIKMLSRANFNMIGIGINTDAVKHYYPKHIVISDIKTLSTQVMAELRNVILQK